MKIKLVCIFIILSVASASAQRKKLAVKYYDSGNIDFQNGDYKLADSLLTTDSPL